MEADIRRKLFCTICRGENPYRAISISLIKVGSPSTRICVKQPVCPIDHVSGDGVRLRYPRTKSGGYPYPRELAQPAVDSARAGSSVLPHSSLPNRSVCYWRL